MSMWFFDETGDLPEYQALREEVRRLEKEYLELRVLLKEAEEALRAAPEDDYLKAKVHYLKKRVKGLEDKNPRFAADWPLEVSLFTPPHG